MWISSHRVYRRSRFISDDNIQRMHMTADKLGGINKNSETIWATEAHVCELWNHNMLIKNEWVKRDSAFNSQEGPKLPSWLKQVALHHLTQTLDPRVPWLPSSTTLSLQSSSSSVCALDTCSSPSCLLLVCAGPFFVRTSSLSLCYVATLSNLAVAVYVLTIPFSSMMKDIG